MDLVELKDIEKNKDNQFLVINKEINHIPESKIQIEEPIKNDITIKGANPENLSESFSLKKLFQNTLNSLALESNV